MSDRRILVVDDERDMVETCSRILRRAGYRVFATTDPERALSLVESDHPDVLLADLNMPDIDGMELMRRAHGVDPTLPVIVTTAFGSIQSAVAAIKAGAFDYLPKNFSADKLTVNVERALQQRALGVENRNLRSQLAAALGLENVIGRSAAMAQIFELVKKAARSEANILVLGESGTGKELIARAIHANSPRGPQAFIPVDCAALPENLLESELFGHEKGSFTGAVHAKAGLMQLADRGTLFLDEIGELPLGLQSKLLRAFQEQQIRRVGSTELVDVDVRIVSATNREIREAIVKGMFREELYYRVNVIEIRLPPLRERTGDIPLLVQAFLGRYGHGRVQTCDDEALAALETYGWPGNVRELQNIIERACALADGETIVCADLPDHVLGRAPAPSAAMKVMGRDASLPLKQAKERWMGVLEASYLRNLLQRHHGNVSAAAKTAGIDRKTFHRLIDKYSLR